MSNHTPPPPTDDVDRLVRARRDPEAFGAFYRAYAEPLYLWALRRTGDAHTATEITAETFARALEGVASFRGAHPGSGVAWLFGIAHNVLRQHFRTRGVEVAARQRLGIQTPAWVPDEIAEADNRIDAERLAGRLDAAVADLPPGIRDVVLMHVNADATHREIADELGISEPNARMRLSRGLARLRDRMTTPEIPS